MEGLTHIIKRAGREFSEVSECQSCLATLLSKLQENFAQLTQEEQVKFIACLLPYTTQSNELDIFFGDKTKTQIAYPLNSCPAFSKISTQMQSRYVARP